MNFSYGKCPANKRGVRGEKRRFVPVPERLIVGGVLAAVGGFMDIYTYILYDGVFANAQTGNVVLLGYRMMNGNFKGALYSLIPIIAYVAGIFVAGICRRRIPSGKRLHWRQLLIMAEIVILAGMGLLSVDTPKPVIVTVISFICSMQVASFDKLDGMPYATTMCTGNLRHMTENFLSYAIDKNKTGMKKGMRYLCVIVSFVFGGLIGAWCTSVIKTHAIWGCCGALTLVLIYLLVKPSKEQRRD